MNRNLASLVSAPVARLPLVGRELADRLIRLGVDGFGPIAGAAQVAAEARDHATDVEAAIERVVALSAGITTLTGFTTGLGGVATLPLTLPSDAVSHFFLSARTAAAIAHLRGHDLTDEAVRSAVLLTVLDEIGTDLRADVGAAGDADLLAALRRLDAAGHRMLRDRAGRGLVARYGEKAGPRLLARLVPFAAAPVAACTNRSWLRGVAERAGRTF